MNRDAIQPRTWHGDNDDQLTIPRFNDPYHDPRSCHDVIRITDYSKPAANALEFKVYYLSPQSQAARNQRFVIMKTTEGP